MGPIQGPVVPAIRDRGEAVRTFIVGNVAKHPTDIVRRTAEKFGYSRQAVHRHIQRLVEEGFLIEDGGPRSRTYRLAQLSAWSRSYPAESSRDEGDVWLSDVRQQLEPLATNVMGIWQYGFTEMFNNALDHAQAQTISVSVTKTAASSVVVIRDDGVGIFRKIQKALDLLDERHAVLELAKGKFTTDPQRHSGEGIFFSSRMFDHFSITSGSVVFSHQATALEDWILETDEKGGTLVRMELGNHTARSVNKVFKQFTSGDEFGFTRTVVPVRLAQYGDDNLVSRSQARRLLARFERFQTVVLDFRGVSLIGQAFADEVFRVFPLVHPEVQLVHQHAGKDVSRMIAHVLGGTGHPDAGG
jgi:anti-sigma regulatory factor (Ser/Thr protein kinase)